MAWQKIRKDGTPAQKPGRKPDPNKPAPSPGKGKGRKGPRPHTWIIGAEAGSYKHDMYLPWLRAKAQANFREEGWELSFEDYFQLWDGKWEQRGRASDQLCMSREDFELPWSLSNCVIVTRNDHLKELGRQRKLKNMTYKPRKKS